MKFAIYILEDHATIIPKDCSEQTYLCNHFLILNERHSFIVQIPLPVLEYRLEVGLVAMYFRHRLTVVQALEVGQV